MLSIFQPVYLFIHIKPGKGNHEQQVEISPNSPQSKPETLSRYRALSINGELVEENEFDSLNIHDYATFEQEKNLLPEFRDSIKKQVPVEANADKLSSPSHPPITRKKSFQDVAKEVCTMEKVLKQWPRRPRSRHHSSSSEDYKSDEVASLASNVDQNLDSLSKSDDLGKRESGSVVTEANNNQGLSTYGVGDNNLEASGGITSRDIKVDISERDLKPESQSRQACGDVGDISKNVVLLAQHAGDVHVDTPALPCSNQSSGKEQQSKITEERAQASGFPAGCCSCVVL